MPPVDLDESEGPVTVAVTRQVIPGKEPEFEEWVHGIGAVAERFPGHLGISVIRPRDRKHPEYVLILKFDTYGHLRAWEESSERMEWIEKVRPLTIGKGRAEVTTGLEFWFDAPGHAAHGAPAKWKMMIITFLAIVPIVQIVPPAVIALLPTGTPGLVVSMAVGAILVPLMTFVVMPLLTRLMAFWLWPRPAASVE